MKHRHTELLVCSRGLATSVKLRDFFAVVWLPRADPAWLWRQSGGRAEAGEAELPPSGSRRDLPNLGAHRSIRALGVPVVVHQAVIDV